MTRTCAYIKCNNEFEPTSKYNPNQKYCCRSHSNYQWLIDNPIKKKNIKKKYDNSKHGKAKNFANKLKRIFNITVEEYNKMFKEQEGKCKICGIDQTKLKIKLTVDHDHKTGKIRGLLCHKCNSVLGYANDDIEIFKNIIKYLI